MAEVTDTKATTVVPTMEESDSSSSSKSKSPRERLAFPDMRRNYSLLLLPQPPLIVRYDCIRHTCREKKRADGKLSGTTSGGSSRTGGITAGIPKNSNLLKTPPPPPRTTAPTTIPIMTEKKRQEIPYCRPLSDGEKEKEKEKEEEVELAAAPSSSDKELALLLAFRILFVVICLGLPVIVFIGGCAMGRELKRSVRRNVMYIDVV